MHTIVFELYQNPMEQVRMINEKAKKASKQIKKELIEELLEAKIDD